MLRKIILMICIAFVVVCYGYPCLIIPFGEYKFKETIEGEIYEESMKFKFDGTFSIGDKTGYYKLSGNKIIISEDETFDDADAKIKLRNLYSFDFSILPGMSMTFTNYIGMYASIGVGVLAIVLILTAPNKRY